MNIKEKTKYVYDGPVKLFNNIIADYWHGETYAVSDKKALSNLSYQFCCQTGREAHNAIRLPGILTRIGVDL